MPRKVPFDLPSPKLQEPYEDYLYADLRHELSVRQIRIHRSGPQRVTRRPGFISLLRDWDVAHGNQVRETDENQTQTRQTRKEKKCAIAMTTMRTVRARRGCRFRLINVLLSPDFNGRWGEMATSVKLVNQFWLDVHAAYLAQNSMLDTLHFEDALFVNVTPNVILAHSASRLVQMWTEIVAMYRGAVAQTKDAAANNDKVHSFFDFCAGRLDLLYLHMAMLLEPKLYELVMSDKIPTAEPFGRTRAKAVATATPKETKAKSVVTATQKVTKANAAGTAMLKAPKVAMKAVAEKKVQAVTKVAATPAAAKVVTGSAVAVLPPAPVKMPAVFLQNPEMVEPPPMADVKCTVVTAAAKTSKSSAKAKVVKPAATASKLAAQKKPVKAAGKSKVATSAEAKPKPSPTQAKIAVTQPKAKTPSKPAYKKTLPGNGSTQTNGKRRREEEVSTAIVAVATVGTVSDIVPHPGNKRVNTATTSTLATRPTDMILPPDEWDILEGRLRKVNENIDRCHRGLATNEGNISDSYKQSLVADLRFYSAIKQRLQEQLLVVMQSGY